MRNTEVAYEMAKKINAFCLTAKDSDEVQKLLKESYPSVNMKMVHQMSSWIKKFGGKK
jgi:hypothetical protein